MFTTKERSKLFLIKFQIFTSLQATRFIYKLRNRLMHVRRFTSHAIIYIFTETINRCYIENCFSEDCNLTFDFKTSERKKYELRFQCRRNF